MSFLSDIGQGFVSNVKAGAYAAAQTAKGQLLDYARGQVTGAVNGLMNQLGLGSLSSYLTGAIFGKVGGGRNFGAGDSSCSSNGDPWTTPSKMFGGISASEAKQLFLDWTGIELASNSLYLIEITDLSPIASFFGGGNTGAFQLFTTSISYSPVGIPPDKQNIGSAVIDGVKNTEHVDLSLTTYDDSYGTLKRWFDAKAAAVAHSDGTIGLPIEYLVKIRILHSFFSDETNRGGYEVSYLMRPVSIEHSLSREDGGKQQLQMQFTQFDTFVPA